MSVQRNGPVVNAQHNSLGTLFEKGFQKFCCQYSWKEASAKHSIEKFFSGGNKKVSKFPYILLKLIFILNKLLCKHIRIFTNHLRDL